MISQKARHLSAVIPAQAGIQRPCFSLSSVFLREGHWIPAFAGMTAEKISVMGMSA
ncbi:MAG: hypothetical protein M3Q96_04100 [Pseudomonadota bacterium]|nr:hypothetical protein [Pseudomonadota bacterium]